MTNAFDMASFRDRVELDQNTFHGNFLDHAQHEYGDEANNNGFMYSDHSTGGMYEELDGNAVHATSVSIEDRLHTKHALHPLTHDEVATYTSMLSHDEDAHVFVGPTHELKSGRISGFCLTVHRDSDCVQLPLPREMFMGTTCVECDPGDKDIHPDVIRLLNNPSEVKASVLAMLAQVPQEELQRAAGAL